jgi:UDP-3-O-[3-hydroxymyristoyl] glucosamine N-acyltransferase
LTARLGEIAEIIGGRVFGDPGIPISGINSLEAAGPGEISFYSNPRYQEQLAHTRAAALIVSAKTELYEGPQVLVADPVLARAKAAAFFAEPVPRYPGGRSAQAVLSESATIAEDVSIYPQVYVGEAALIGKGTVLFPGVYVGDRVRIGEHCVIYPNVTILQDCRVGNYCIIHAGTVIGSDGFGFAREGDVSVKIPHRGTVQIDDHVEIGANNAIDRAAMGKTWIRTGVKTDNLVHVGHNVVVGENTLILAQVGISGSTEIGRGVVLGGQVGITDHLTIGDGSLVIAQSGIAKSLPPGSVVAGSPSLPHRLWLRAAGLLKRLPEINERLRRVEQAVDGMAGRLSGEEGPRKKASGD